LSRGREKPVMERGWGEERGGRGRYRKGQEGSTEGH